MTASMVLYKFPENVQSNFATCEQMLTLDKNPFVWNERGNISGRVGALSLAAQDGSLITVENLSKDIEVSSGSAIMAEDFYLQNRTFFCATVTISTILSGSVPACSCSFLKHLYFALFSACSAY